MFVLNAYFCRELRFVAILRSKLRFLLRNTGVDSDFTQNFWGKNWRLKSLLQSVNWDDPGYFWWHQYPLACEHEILPSTEDYNRNGNQSDNQNGFPCHCICKWAMNIWIFCIALHFTKTSLCDTFWLFLVSLCDIYINCNMVMGHFRVPAPCLMHLWTNLPLFRSFSYHFLSSVTVWHTWKFKESVLVH